MIGNNENHVFRDMESVKFSIAASFFCLFALVVAGTSWYFFPSLPMGVVVIASMLISFVLTFVICQRYMRQQREAFEKAQNEYREMMEANKQKQIDEMRRANSRVPKAGHK